MTADFDARFRGRLQRSIAHGSNRVRTRFHSASDGIASLRLAACGLRLAACGFGFGFGFGFGGKSSVKRVRYRRSAARRHASGNWPSRRRPVHSPSIPAKSPRIGGTRRASRGPCFHGAAPGTTGIVRDAHGPTPVARRAAETGPARAEAGIMRSAAREPEPDEAGRARRADQWR
ncbi:hypothetical protein [Burkholderia pseudomallei]|uniref:hypothetical protein n=1 Tax=Burkholderia pseudomallei TaxID=28450 RepID=UPI0016069814|nr:hypothetical protein [Burkholderia pseudomallei]MBD2936946.1 hypothetical protein [Burkholderia pseudomallei]MBD2962608.1 hypothetical protein [Burkholderia pseudomallei]